MKRRVLLLLTTVYGAVGALLIILFAVVESLVSEALEARMGLPDLVGAAIAGATVALIVIPLRGRFSRWMYESTHKQARSTTHERSAETPAV